jgi:hypothetical protein
MRLIELSVRNFRGFGAKVPPINLDADLVLLFGPNGHGKTSFAEAIEWLFYGTTKRRQRGEEFSRAEYAGTFANVHGHTPTEVSLKVCFHGQDTVLSRRLGDRETSTTFVNGQPSDFSSIGLLPQEAHYPVVAQHGLQTFVHSKPKDRRDAICAALGLEELTSLKSSLESARASFQRSPPASVTDGRKRLRELTPGLASTPSLNAVVQRWNATPLAVDVTEDERLLLDAAAKLTGEPTASAEDALSALRRARDHAGKSVFDVTPVAPKPDHDDLRAAAAARLNELAIAVAAVDDRISDLSAVSAASYSAALLSFWKQGLELAPTGDECPMCEASTLAAEQRDTLIGRLHTAKATVAAHDALTNSLEAWERSVAPVGNAVKALGIQGLDEAGRAALRALVGESDLIVGFFATHDAFDAARRDLGQALRRANEVARGTKARSGSATSLPDLVRDRQASRTEVAAATTDFVQSLAAYKGAWDRIQEPVSSKISANAYVTQIDAVGLAVRRLADVRLLTRYAAILAEAQHLIRSIEATSQSKQEELLKSRGQEVSDMYALLNPAANVGFESMEPANDAMKLHATSFGRRMSAAANLSECQLNCLGLAVWLMRATTPTSPFGFVLLDDPVQAMDDDHAEAFVAQVVPHLLDRRGKQVVVLSHVKNVTDRLRLLNMSREVLLYHYENFDVGGPIIILQQRLQQALAEIKGAAIGNEANRAYAVDRLRVLVEAFVRELHVQATGMPPPATYDTANSGQLADLFRVIPGTLPQDHAAMRDTIRFCDPAHHTQAGYSPPLKSNIQPHIDRVDGLMKKYGLI